MEEKIKQETKTQDNRSELLKNFGERLKELRLKNNLNQTEFGKKVELSPQQISEYENGKKAPLIDTVMRIAEVYDCSIDWLCKGEVIEPKCNSYKDLFTALDMTESFLRNHTYLGDLNIRKITVTEIQDICLDPYETAERDVDYFCLYSKDRYFQRYLEVLKGIRQLLENGSIKYGSYEMIKKGVVSEILNDIEKDKADLDNLPFYWLLAK